jgi:hypothetical protein
VEDGCFSIEREGRLENEVRTVTGLLHGPSMVDKLDLMGSASDRRCGSMSERRMCSSSTMASVDGSRTSEWYLSRRAVKRPVQ